jgi:Rrf2 family protein
LSSRQFTSSGAVHFSTRGEYGVRLMAELARHFGTGPVSLAEVAEHEDLPRPYLEQLVSSLRDADLVTSTRGARGGYQLTRDPREIRMSDVLRALEGPIVPMVCANEDPIHALDCGRTGYCNVNLMWVRVREAIVTTLESLTLADVSRGMPPAHRPLASADRAATSSSIPVITPH